MDFRGSRTEANLAAAFAGETQATAKYRFYAKLCRDAGYEEIAAIFEETAANETAHAYQWFSALRGGELPTVEGALLDAAGGEHFEWSKMYREFADKAKEEGFMVISRKMELVADVEKMHEERFRRHAKQVEEGSVFQSEEDTVWICRVCGHTYRGKQPPLVCPICGRPQGFFERVCEGA